MEDYLSYAAKVEKVTKEDIIRVAKKYYGDNFLAFHSKMGKAEKGTPKWIANRAKAKGLQKLRWYCQMCQKQCRDENGFKCHTSSETHQRQLLLFAENANEYLDSFSK